MKRIIEIIVEFTVLLTKAIVGCTIILAYSIADSVKERYNANPSGFILATMGWTLLIIFVIIAGMAVKPGIDSLTSAINAARLVK